MARAAPAAPELIHSAPGGAEEAQQRSLAQARFLHPPSGKNAKDLQSTLFSRSFMGVLPPGFFSMGVLRSYLKHFCEEEAGESE